MKRNYRTFAPLFFFTLFAISAKLLPEKKYVTLSSLLSSKKYNTAILHNPKGCHYLNPMLLQVSNKTKEDLYIVITPGEIYTPSDPKCQDLLTTSGDTFLVRAENGLTRPIAGMCIEPHDGGGYEKIEYKFLKNANEKLKQLADYISEKKYQSSAAQNAVWSLVEQGRSHSISSNNNEELIGLTRVVEKITGRKPKPEAEILHSNKTYYTPVTYQNKYWGEFAFKHNTESNLKLGLFNKRGIQVRELYNNPHHPKGNTSVPFAFDMAEYTDSTYTLILVKNQEILSRTVLKPYMN